MPLLSPGSSPEPKQTQKPSPITNTATIEAFYRLFNLFPLFEKHSSIDLDEQWTKLPDLAVIALSPSQFNLRLELEDIAYEMRALEVKELQAFFEEDSERFILRLSGQKHFKAEDLKSLRQSYKIKEMLKNKEIVIETIKSEIELSVFLPKLPIHQVAQSLRQLETIADNIWVYFNGCTKQLIKGATDPSLRALFRLTPVISAALTPKEPEGFADMLTALQSSQPELVEYLVKNLLSIGQESKACGIGGIDPGKQGILTGYFRDHCSKVIFPLKVAAASLASAAQKLGNQEIDRLFELLEPSYMERDGILDNHDRYAILRDKVSTALGALAPGHPQVLSRLLALTGIENIHSPYWVRISAIQALGRINTALLSEDDKKAIIRVNIEGLAQGEVFEKIMRAAPWELKEVHRQRIQTALLGESLFTAVKISSNEDLAKISMIISDSSDMSPFHQEWRRIGNILKEDPRFANDSKATFLIQLMHNSEANFANRCQAFEHFCENYSDHPLLIPIVLDAWDNSLNLATILSAPPFEGSLADEAAVLEYIEPFREHTKEYQDANNVETLSSSSDLHFKASYILARMGYAAFVRGVSGSKPWPQYWLEQARAQHAIEQGERPGPMPFVKIGSSIWDKIESAEADSYSKSYQFPDFYAALSLMPMVRYDAVIEKIEGRFWALHGQYDEGVFTALRLASSRLLAANKRNIALALAEIARKTSR